MRIETYVGPCFTSVHAMSNISDHGRIDVERFPHILDYVMIVLEYLWRRGKKTSYRSCGSYILDNEKEQRW